MSRVPRPRRAADDRRQLVLLGVAALALVGLLLWHHREWRRGLDEAAVSLDNVAQARKQVQLGYLALERALAGDPATDSAEAVARFERAELILRDWLEGRGSLLGMQARPPDAPALQPRVLRYLHSIAGFREHARAALRGDASSAAAEAIDRRARIAAIAREGDELEFALYDQLRLLRARQEERLVALLAAAVLIVGVVGLLLARLMRARRQAGAALRDSEERLRQLADNVEAVLWMTDTAGGRNGYLSPAYERIWGRSAVALERDPGEWTAAIHPDDQPRVLAAIEASGRTGAYDETYRIVRPDGTMRWIHDRAIAVRDAEGALRRLVGLAQDVTAERAEQTRRTELERQLRQSQKMEAIGTLAGGIAHDFNNVLAAVVSSAELARLEVPDRPRAQEALAQVLGAAARAKELTRRILTFSRQQEQVRAPVALDHVADEVCTLLRATLPATIEVRSELVHGASVVAHADAAQVYQVLMNLGVNAAHAMRERGGILRVEVAPAEDAALPAKPMVGLRASRSEGWVRLRVADTGCGMSPAVLERIFEPFFTTEDVGDGTGLGLAVVHGIVTAHEGVIDVHSREREGTRFDVYLPRARSAVAAAAPAAAAVLAPGRGERILIVDDEPWIVASARQLFERLGYEVFATSDSAAALAEFRRRPDDFALVLTDQTMPTLTGLELAERLLELRPRLPIVLMTGYSGQVTRDVALARGVRSVVTKPFTLAEVSAAVRAALDGAGGRTGG